MTHDSTPASKSEASPKGHVLTEQRLRTMMDHATDAVITSDDTGRITYLNHSAERMFGHLAGEAIGKPLTILMPERYREAHLRGLEAHLKTGHSKIIGRTVELTGLRSDGTEFPIEIALGRWGSSDEVLVTATIRDITERKRAEDLLADSEKKFRELVGNLPIGVFKTAAEGTVLEANRACALLLGLPGPEALIGRNSAEVYARPEDRKAHGALAMQQREVNSVELQLRRADGTAFWALGSARAIYRPDGKLDGFEGTFEDISSRVGLEAATKRLTELQDLVIRVLGHDLKAPITVLQGYLELAGAALRDGAAQGSQAQAIRAISKASEAASSMLVLLANARAVSRLTMTTGRAPSAQPVDLVRMVVQSTAMLRPMAETKGIHLEVSAAPDVRALLPPAFESVVANLVSNAIKYTPDGGRITVTLERGPPVVLSVADTGPGVPVEKRERLFKKFDRLSLEQSVGSHGLGLSIAASMVELAGGTISVGNRADNKRGAVFRVELPAAETPMKS